MKKTDSSKAGRKPGRILCLLLSLAAALLLFISPQFLSIAICLAVFVLVLVLLLTGFHLSESVSDNFCRNIAACLALPVLLAGWNRFIPLWVERHKTAMLASSLHLTPGQLVRIAALLLCAVGFYAVYTCILWMIGSLIHFLESRLYKRNGFNRWANMLRNWWFILGGISFFG